MEMQRKLEQESAVRWEQEIYPLMWVRRSGDWVRRSGDWVRRSGDWVIQSCDWMVKSDENFRAWLYPVKP